MAGVSFLINFHIYRLNKDSCTGFSFEFSQIFQNAFFAKQLWVTVSAKYPFLFVTSTSATKNVSFKLDYFKYFRDKHHKLLANNFLWRSLTDSQLWLSWFIEKMRFSKTSQTSQKTSKMKSLFCKTVSLQACICTKKGRYHCCFPVNKFMW